MPWKGITLAPGLNAEVTPTAMYPQAGYASTTLGRFKAALFQKVGGWSKFINLTISGSPKSSHAWQSLNNTKYYAVGSTQELGAFTTSPSHQVITPQTFTSDTAINFSTVIGSTTVTVVDTGISTVTTYDSVFFNTPVSIDGIVLSGLYAITASLSATSYTITAATPGVAGVLNAGTVPTFQTVSGSQNVTVVLANHGLVAGSDIVFPIGITLGGITIQGRYVVVSISNPNTCVITASQAATGNAGPTAINANKAELVYYISTGPIQPGGVYGAGNYGAGAYGFGGNVIGQTGTSITATDWTLSNWGELLISCPENGGIYYWGPNSGFLNTTVIPTAPIYNSGTFVSIAQQIVIAYGSTVNATVGVYQDPMFIRWCTVGDFTTWNAAITDQAGSFRIPSGSRIVAGASTPYCNLIWTDLDVWSMNYIGAQLVYGFVKTGSNCGLIGKHAFTQLSGNVYWLGRNNFFVMSGGNVNILPCTAYDVLFQDLDTANQAKCVVGANTLHSEIWIFYPSISGGLGIPDKYVKYNTIENTWDAGPMQRNTWLDQTVFGPPLAATDGGLIYQHESGYDADTGPMTSGFTTAYHYVDEGREFVFIDKIIPDFKFGTWAGAKAATLQITVNVISEMGDTPITYGPYTATSTTNEIDTRIRGRQVSFTVQSSDSGSFWRLGKIRVRFAPDGRR